MINTDAHTIEQLDYMKVGVGAAKKGWIGKKSVVNALEPDQLVAFLKRKKAE